MSRWTKLRIRGADNTRSTVEGRRATGACHNGLAVELLLVTTVLGICQTAWTQSPTYGLGRTPSAEEVRAWDIAISPTGKELPPGQGTAKEGAALYVRKGCAGCHGATGSGGHAPTLISAEGPSDAVFGALSRALRERRKHDGGSLALRDDRSGITSIAACLWGKRGRSRPMRCTPLPPSCCTRTTSSRKTRSWTPQSLPKVKMPNRDGFALPPEVEARDAKARGLYQQVDTFTVVPDHHPERSRHPVVSFFRSSIARPSGLDQRFSRHLSSRSAGPQTYTGSIPRESNQSGRDEIAMTTASSDRSIKVGVITDMTGPLSFLGIANANVAEMVINEINARDGLLGQRVDLLLEDSATTDRVAEAKAKKLVEEDHVDVIFGGIYSSTRQAIKGPAVTAGQKALHLPGAIRGPGMSPAHLLHRAGPGPTGRAPDSLVDAENRGEEILLPVGRLYLAARVEPEIA